MNLGFPLCNSVLKLEFFRGFRNILFDLEFDVMDLFFSCV